MKCKNCGRDVELIPPDDKFWQSELEEGMKYRHAESPTKSCHGGGSEIVSAPESEIVSQILSKYLD